MGFHQVRLTPREERTSSSDRWGITGCSSGTGTPCSGFPRGGVCLGRSAKTKNQIALVEGIHYLVQGDGQAGHPFHDP